MPDVNITPGGMGAGFTIHIRETGALATTKKILGLNAGLSQTAVQMVGLGTAAMIGYRAFSTLSQIVTDSISKFREYEYRIAEINTILRETDEEIIPSFIEGISNLSMKFGQATSDLAKGMYDILSAAFPAEDAMILLNTATKASIAGLSTVRESVDIFTTVLNTYGMSARQAANVSDMLFQSVVRGKFQFRDLESSLGYVVPIAAQAGIEFKELMAALSTTTRHGLHLDMTSRGLALAIQGIVNPTEGASEAARKYGIDMSAVGLRALGLSGWFSELNKATKIYGKTIISELIPNMRSLRVAMVLAGDEGIGGFIDDLNQLDTAAGRTVEALEEIMETDLFKQKKIEQIGERIERGWGEALSKPALAGSEALLKFAVALTSGSLWGGITGITRGMQRYGEVLGVSTQEQTGFMTSLDESIAEIEDLAQQIQLLRDNSFQLDINISELNKSLEDEVVAGTRLQYSFKGTLGYEKALIEANKNYADTMHDIKMGLADENYQFDTLSPNIQNAIRYVREFEKNEKDLSDTMTSLNYAMRENNLEMMKIQLKGMKRRRGLNRMEQQAIKKLQIANLEMRIETEETAKHATKIEYDTYLAKKKIIDDTLRDAEELRYQLSYNYNQQLADINSLIASERDVLDIRVGQWDITNQQIYDMAIELRDKLANVKLQYGDVEGLPEIPDILGGAGAIPATTERKKTWKFEGGRWVLSYQRGTYYVPHDTLAQVHRGEQIVPRGGARNNVSVSPSITVNMNVNNNDDLESLGQRIQELVYAGVVKGVETAYE